MSRVPVEVPVGDRTEIVDKSAAQPEVGQYFYTDAEMKRLAEDPAFLLDYRKRIEAAISVGFAIFYKNTEASRIAQAYMRSEMARKLDNHPVLTKKLIPEWPVGCR
jgi:hypothetical protein